jgi:hypothetical protein
MLLIMTAIKPKLWLVEGATHTKVRTSMLDDLIQIIIAFFNDSLRNPA